MKKSLTLSLAILVGLSPAVAQTTTDASAARVCQVQEDALGQLESKYKPEQDRLKERGDEIKDEAPDGLEISGEIKFEDAHIALDLPQVTMLTTQVVFDVPQVTMKQKKISFDIVEMKMERREIGRKPEVTCKWGPWGPKCTTKWTPIYADIPVFKKVTKEFSTDIPEVRMDRQDLSFDLPDVSMKRVDMHYKLPYISVANPIPDTGPTEEKGKALEADAKSLAGRINADSAEGVAALFSCHTDQLFMERAKVSSDFDEAISQMDAAIASVRSIGANPEDFGLDGNKTNLVRQREELTKQRDDALTKIDSALKKFDATADKDVTEAVGNTPS